MDNKQQLITQVLIKTSQLSYLLLAELAQLLKNYDLSEPQFNVLRILRGAKGEALNLFQINERMIHKSSNTTRLIDKLREKRLIDTRICPGNRRKMDININDAGMELLSDIDPYFDEFRKDIDSRISDDEARTLNTLLDKLSSI